MVLIMVTGWYPPDKDPEVAKKMIEVEQKIPEDPSIRKPLVRGVSSDKDGLKIIAIFEVAKGKYEEALSLTVRRMIEAHSIEGFRYELETLMTGEEAASLSGLTTPS